MSRENDPIEETFENMSPEDKEQFLTLLAQAFGSDEEEQEENEEPESLVEVSLSEEQMEAIQEHAERCFGVVPSVFHEIVSVGFHCDILFIPASEKMPFVTLCTMGLSAHEMPVPSDEIRSLMPWSARCELVMHLPADWEPIFTYTAADPEERRRSYAPVRMLKEAARLIYNSGEWFCYGHTLSGIGDPEAPADSPEAQHTHLLLLAPLPDCGDDRATVLTLPGGESLSFLQVLSVSVEELSICFKAENYESPDWYDFITRRLNGNAALSEIVRTGE
ncbi:MAG: suppressor of fused domain protein [Akkermansia sp.]